MMFNRSARHHNLHQIICGKFGELFSQIPKLSLIRSFATLKQIKTLGISQMGLPFKLDVSVTLEGIDWALWQRQQEKVPPGFGCQLWKGTETPHNPRNESS